MQNRIIIPLLCAAAIALACGPWSKTSRNDDEQNAVTVAAATNSDTPKRFVTTDKSKDSIATSFEVSVNEGDNGVHFALRVTNNTQKLAELQFPNGQTHDFMVLDEVGKKVWRWSEGRMFTQAVRAKMLRSHRTVTFENDWEVAKLRGTYTAVAMLKVEGKPVEKRIEFTLPMDTEKHLTVAVVK